MDERSTEATAGASTPSSRARDPWTLAFLGVSLVAVAFLLYLGRHVTFFWDEWSWIVHRQDWSFDTLVQPYNEHWSMVPLVIYKVLLDQVGLRSYVPYLVVLLVLHAAVAGAIFTLVRRQIGPAVALAFATALLFFGVGHEMLFWAAGLGFLAAVAPGAWALVLLLERPGSYPWGVACLLLISVAATGVGLFFVAAAFVAVLLGTERRRRVWMLVPALVAYAIWYVTLGRTALQTPISIDSLPGLPVFILQGTGAAVSSITGMGRWVAAVLLVLVAVALVTAIWRRHPARVGAIAAAAGLMTEFILIGLVRAPNEAALSRYQYVAVVFVLILTSSVLSTLPLRRRYLAVAVAVVAVISVASSVPMLFQQRNWYLARADTTRALLSLQARYGGSPAMPENEHHGGRLDRGLLVVSAPSIVARIEQRYGLPLTDAISGTFPISAPAIDGVLFQLVKSHIAVQASTELLGDLAPVTVVSAEQSSVTEADRCLTVQPGGADPRFVIAAPGGATMYLRAEASAEARVFLSLHGNFAESFQMNYDHMEGFVPVLLTSGQLTGIKIPDLGDPQPWLVRVDVPSTGSTLMCLGPPAL